MSANLDIETNAEDQLTIGGIEATKLIQQYGTPLNVYDVSRIRSQIRKFKKVFEEEETDYEVSYASKAFSSIAIFQVMAQENMHIDVVSGGELYTALQAHFPASQISFHGNNKSREELSMALENHVGTIIVDNFHELELLQSLLEEQPTTVNIILRVAPGVSAHTHEYDQTGQIDSKFGFDIDSGQADQAFEMVNQNSNLNLIGIHGHIGSQIFESEGFDLEVERLMQLLVHWKERYDFVGEVLNVGGGFGIQYVGTDNPPAPEELVRQIIQNVRQAAEHNHLPLPAIWIEPGRSLVGPAGYSLYTIGSRKDIPNYQPYVSVDGGMGDNIRPALYQADYSGVVANKVHAPVVERVRISGKYCESGDILIKNQPLPETKPGDIFAILATGAYGYSMASNYNRNPRPAVVFVENDRAQVVIKRETFQDLVNLDSEYFIK